MMQPRRPFSRVSEWTFYWLRLTADSRFIFFKCVFTLKHVCWIDLLFEKILVYIMCAGFWVANICLSPKKNIRDPLFCAYLRCELSKDWFEHRLTSSTVRILSTIVSICDYLMIFLGVFLNQSYTVTNSWDFVSIWYFDTVCHALMCECVI